MDTPGTRLITSEASLSCVLAICWADTPLCTTKLRFCSCIRDTSLFFFAAATTDTSLNACAVAFQLEVQYDIGIACFYIIQYDIFVTHIFNVQCVSTVFHIQGVVAVHIGDGALRGSCYLHGSSGQRFPGLLGR